MPKRGLSRTAVGVLLWVLLFASACSAQAPIETSVVADVDLNAITVYESPT